MKRAYLLGIGGAGMAGIAQLLLQKGWQVAGYDRSLSTTARHLKTSGIPIDTVPLPARLHNADLCVYSAAIPNHFPLLMQAKETLPTYSRGEMMGNLAKEYQTTVAVAGTHGKTTTVGMLTQITLCAGIQPGVLIGGHFSPVGGYGQKGNPSLLICEACEYGESFLHLSPTIGILLNIDRDHLEYYGSMKHLLHGFERFCNRCDTCLVNHRNPNAVTAARSHQKVIFFGEEHRLHAKNLREEKGFFSFTLAHGQTPLEEITLKVPGKHQVENALAAACAGFALGFSSSVIKEGLESFAGVNRRFQILYQNANVTVADDYAHHPTEIAATLITAKTMGFSKVTAIFQPFTYSRTALLFREFADALSLADRVILAPVMAGREPPKEGVSSHLIADLLPHTTVCENLSHCGAVAISGAQKGELLLTLGCGNVNECAYEIRDFFQNRNDFVINT